MTAESKPHLADAPAVVLFGRDGAGKPHASSFTTTEAKLAEKAAELMGLKVLPIATEAERVLAAKVPKGRVFATGKAFAPFIKPELFVELQAASLKSGVTALKLVASSIPSAVVEASTGTLQSSASEGAPPAKPQKGRGGTEAKQPCGWADIRVGTIILAAAPPRYSDWFECVVVAAEGDDLFTLRYCDWPNEPTFVRRRVQLALMHPAHKPEPPLEPDPSPKAA